MARPRKRFSHASRKGDAGIALLHRLVNEMGFRWQVAGGTEVGIDGHIELFDPASGEAFSAWLLAQSKAYTAFPGENDTGFHFICDEADVDYWLRQPIPVILVCSHPETGEAWWRHVQEALRDPQALKRRRIDFDKKRDRLCRVAAPALIDIGLSAAPRAWAPMLSRRERVVTNLLPVIRLAPVFYGAPTRAKTARQAIDRLAGAECHGSDWVLHNNMVFSFRGFNDVDGPLHVLADDAPEEFDTAEWSQSKDPDTQRQFVRLLNGTMRDMYAQDLMWYRPGQYFFFKALDLDQERRVATGSSSGRIVFTSRVIDGDEGPILIWHRHHALRCHFLRFDGSWYLSLEPTYHFTYDGYNRSRKSGEWVKKMKTLERNSAVRGLITFWAKYLRQPEGFFDEPDPRIGFGALAALAVDRGIDDKAWKRYRAATSDAPAGDETQAELRLFDDEDEL